ncbi:hypothetical protein DL89DRAFT_294186 [Linderina pennispora]|uniref:RGS domain-containing protein n=1 Tax=Linderina pennispora TaxID=61395 RepID=A0A1Y1W4Y7_9FUNG|nr:uncharacterized protein DL89DRAFT_294186 [Linderina pennispora]ORX68286.1 hypothetical protein DL89DRAFT_294186 [Linderina pennispora]
MTDSKLQRKRNTAADSEIAGDSLHVDTRPSLLDTATSLISPENRRPQLNLAYSSSASSFFTNHNNSNTPAVAAQPRHLERGLLQGQRSFEETVDRNNGDNVAAGPASSDHPTAGVAAGVCGVGVDDMLTRKAQAPLCLFNYWQYLAEVEGGAQELQFWLALASYEELCRSYAGTLPPVPLNVYSPNSRQAAGNARRISLVEASARILAMAPSEASRQELTASNRISSAVSNLDKDTQQLDSYLASLSHQTAVAGAQTACTQHEICRSDHGQAFSDRLFSGDAQAVDAAERVSGDNTELPLLAPSQSETKEGVATQAEIRRAAERLFFQFVQSGAPLRCGIERERRIDPELFAPSYPRFLRERIYHNTTRATAAPRIALGLALIFIALTFQFSLIFLDVTPKGWRWLPIACLWPGFVLGFAGVSRIDPVLALDWQPVRDRHIKDSHLKKASVQLAVTALIAVVITLVLFLVPGHHL